MKRLLTLSAAVICCTAVFGAAAPAAAKNYEYCRRDVSYMLSCGFETLAGHAAIIPLIAVGVKPLSNGCLLALANSLACCRRAQKKQRG
jgi:Protein of unknown function (DUF3551)